MNWILFSSFPSTLFTKTSPTPIYAAFLFPSILDDTPLSHGNAILNLKLSLTLWLSVPDISWLANNKWKPVALPNFVILVSKSSIIPTCFPTASKNNCWNSSTIKITLGKTISG